MNWTPTVHHRYWQAFGVLALFALIAGCSPARPSASPPVSSGTTGPRPNFVLVMADDLDATLMPYMPKVKQLLTNKGTSLNRYYVNIPWCCPSRATTLRGQYAHNTGIFSVNPPGGGYVEFYKRGEERSTLATWLQAAGYRTGLFGKYLNGFPGQVPELPLTYVPPNWNTWVTPVKGHPFGGFDYTLSVNGRLVKRPPTPDSYLTDVLAGEAEKFVTAQDQRPFFAFVTPLTPHLPAIPAPRHEGRFPNLKAPRPPNFDPPDTSGRPTELRRLPRVTEEEEQRWDEMFRQRARSVLAVDDMVGDLVDALRAEGKLDNTYFILTTDNGFHIGQYRMAPGKNTGYEEDTRVPFIVRGPGVRAGQTVSHLAGNTDVAATVADLARAQAPAWVDGRSLRPLLTGHRPSPASWRRAFLLQHGPARATDPAPRWDRPGPPPNPYTPETRHNAYLPAFSGVRTDRYLYLEYVTNERELYDLHTDPYQLKNIAESDPMAGQLSAWLAKLRRCTGKTCHVHENHGP